jgi:ATP-dependent DNA helicase RecG
MPDQLVSRPARATLGKRQLTPAEARELKDLGLIEGRTPRFFISAKVAEALGQKARYIHNRGLDDGYYRRLVLDYLQRYGRASRADLDALLLPKLPDVLDAGQKANKVKNLMQGLRRAGAVHKRGPRSSATWHLGPNSSGKALDKHGK